LDLHGRLQKACWKSFTKQHNIWFCVAWAGWTLSRLTSPYVILHAFDIEFLGTFSAVGRLNVPMDLCNFIWANAGFLLKTVDVLRIDMQQKILLSEDV
jgi:hypothetical protein